MMVRTCLTAAALLALASLTAVPAAAQSPSGTAEKVSQAVNASGGAGARVLEVEGPVYSGDELRSDRRGEAQILFADDTRLVVGPNARVTVDSFVLSGGTARAATFSAVRGAFRFISGHSPKSVYLIRTPVMTIGVRGTGLDGFVEAGSGRTTIAVYEGTVEACDAADQCILVDAGCTIVVVPPGGGFEQPTPATRGLFLPYSLSQASLLPPYRLDTSACQGAAPSFTTPREDTGRPAGGGGGDYGGANEPNGARE